MKHTFEQKVYYSDTDAYGVVWHGSYVRWLEMGRTDFAELLGHSIAELAQNDIVLPVVSLNIKYKSSAKLDDVMIVETAVQKLNSVSAIFEQKILNKITGKTFLEATVEIVAIDNNGKLYRKLPQVLVDMFEKAMKDEICV